MLVVECGCTVAGALERKASAAWKPAQEAGRVADTMSQDVQSVTKMRDKF